MFKGQLRMCILKILDTKPCSGYAIMKQLNSLTGKKPSSGSLYPLLESMQKEGIVKHSAQGRKKIYTLRIKAKSCMSEKEKNDAIDDMLQRMRTFDHITDTNISEFAQEILERIKKGERPFDGLEDDFSRYRSALLRLVKENKMDTHKKQIKTIIRAATSKLEAL